jgi:hypothetical protein
MMLAARTDAPLPMPLKRTPTAAERGTPGVDQVGVNQGGDRRPLERSQRHPERTSFGQASRVRVRRTNQTKIAAVAAATRETDANGRSASRESL